MILLDTRGFVYVWGNGDSYQAGDGMKHEQIIEPKCVHALKEMGVTVSEVHGIHEHIIVKSTQGNWYAWGTNKQNCLLGLSADYSGSQELEDKGKAMEYVKMPMHLNITNSDKILRIVPGSENTLIIKVP